MFYRVFSRLSLLLVATLCITGVTDGAAQPIVNSTATPDQERLITLITNGWVDVRSILRTVAADVDLGLQMGPEVEGEVNLHLEDVPLDQALLALMAPIDLGYEIVLDSLIVFKKGLVNRWFDFDYPATEREGTGELSVSPRAAGGGEEGGGGSSGKNESNVKSSTKMKIWPDVVAALTALVFQGASELSGSSEDAGGSVNLADPEGRSLIVNPMAGVIQVTAEWNRVHKIEILLQRLGESLLRQVAIEVQILEVTLNDGHQTGINWHTITGDDYDASMNSVNDDIGNTFFDFVVNADKVAGMLEAVSTQGDLRVVSSPRITTLNNQKAVVRVVTEEVYFEAEVEPLIVTDAGSTQPVVNYSPRIIPIGVVLDVTPQVSADGSITLNVHPTISNVLRIVTSPNEDTQPVISVRELDTVGTVKDGQTLVIAGLMYEGNTLNNSGVPLLKDIPLLGYLFKKSSWQKTDIELVMLLTPVILDDERIEQMAESAQAEMAGKL